MSESEHTKTPREAVRRQQPAESAPQAGGRQEALPFGPEFLLMLQRTVGNQEVNNLLRRYHAAQTTAARSPLTDPPRVAPEVGLEGGRLSGDLSSRINSNRGGGSPLDDTTRTGMEAAFGLSLGDVRVHTDGEADALNRSVSAKAFTTGSDIFFSTGAYAPGSRHGNELLGHELTHVAQQRSGSGGSGSSELTVGPAGDSHEREAEATGAAAAALLESGPPAIDTTAATGSGAAATMGGGTASRLIARSAVASLQRQGSKVGSVKTNFTVKNDTTTVDGETLQDVVDAIGEGEAGNTDWAPTYSVTTDDSGKVTGVTVDVPITVTLPTWSGRAKAGKKARAEWDRFRAALKKHEDGHVKLAKETLKGVARKMVGKSEADAQTLWDAAVADLQTASDAYDAANDHGRTAGTVIDVDVDAPKAGTGQGTAAPVQPKLQRLPVMMPSFPLIQRAVVYATAPTSAAEDPAFQAVTGKVKDVAKTQKAHPPAKKKADQATAAAVSPPSETAAKAAANQTDKMAAAQPKPFDKAGFKAALHQKIDDLAPKNLDEMDKFKESGKVQQMQGGLTAQVKAGEKQSAGGVEDTAKEAPNTAGIAPKPVTPLPPNDGGTAPASIDAAPAAPKPKG
ncbi:MAG: DUF4157 domain-containing protein, partial [Chloroflexi bacterium]|nr:DUF4157 domain-containing protein [Chloroflexota bacterium]